MTRTREEIMKVQLKDAEDTAQSACNGLLCGSWFTDRPKLEGWYWCYQYANTRMVHLWAYKTGAAQIGKLYTNEDGGACVTDRLYDGVKWFGPIQPPPIT